MQTIAGFDIEDLAAMDPEDLPDISLIDRVFVARHRNKRLRQSGQLRQPNPSENI